MRCERCGKEVDRLYGSWPTAVTKVMGKLRNIQFVCFDCLSPKEKVAVKLREYMIEDLAKKPIRISRFTYEEACRILDTFKCPKGWDPHRCDGRSCPVKQVTVKDGFVEAEEYYWDCRDYLKAESLILGIVEGKVVVDDSPCPTGTVDVDGRKVGAALNEYKVTGDNMYPYKTYRYVNLVKDVKDTGEE